MHIGSHSYTHSWLGTLSKEDQKRDIERSLALFDAIGVERQGFTFCYPFGHYNADTLHVLEELGCACAFTTKFDLAHVRSGSALLELPRLDTNHLPKDGGAPANEWTERAIRF